jgi:hypothetical protein
VIGPVGASVARSFPARAIRDATGIVTGSAAPSAELADGWIAGGRNHDENPRDFGVWVICAKTG